MPAGRVVVSFWRAGCTDFPAQTRDDGKSRPTWQTGMSAQARRRAASVADLGIQVRYASLDAIRPTCFLLAHLPQSAVSSAFSPTSLDSYDH